MDDRFLLNGLFDRRVGVADATIEADSLVRSIRWKAGDMAAGWLGLMIGNSRLHWTYVEQGTSGETVYQTWDSEHVFDEAIAQSFVSMNCPMTDLLPLPVQKRVTQAAVLRTIPLVMASVVPSQTDYWRAYPHGREIMLADIPLSNVYSTLGIDRALAVLGAWQDYGKAALVIDGGTALTMTGVNQEGRLIGGAILPGVRLQLRSLHHNTAALPDTMFATGPDLSRWQTNTPDAIRSGVWYGLLAGVKDFVQDWLRQYADSVIVCTGGDGGEVCRAIASKFPSIKMVYDPHVIFKGMTVVLNGTDGENRQRIT